MSYRDDEKRWKMLQDVLSAEAAGKELRPMASQRTLFGIPSTVEQTIERIVAEDEEARRMKREKASELKGAQSAGAEDVVTAHVEGSAADGGAAGSATAAAVGAPADTTAAGGATAGAVAAVGAAAGAVAASAPAHVEHPLQPIFDKNSRVLVLGSMPSPASREVGFYYGHPQNRFWRVLAELFDEPLATTNERRRDQLLRHHIALWDVLASCDIAGASDASIANAQANDLSPIFATAPIEAVFCTGAKAAELYTRLCEPVTGMPCVKLPSTSPANAAARLDDLVEAYRALLPHLHETPAPVLDVPDVVATEQALDAAGTTLAELMDRAGTSIAYRVHRLHPRANVVVLCGNGNNGGDGWVAARELSARGHKVALVCARMPEDLRAQPARDVASALLPELQENRVRIFCSPDDIMLTGVMGGADVIIDALLGTGFAGATVKEPFASWIREANLRREAGARVYAADTPSGLNAQTGDASDPCIVADETITMIVSKTGLALPGSARFTGALRVAPLAYLEG